MRIKVISDGSPVNCRVYDLDTGEELRDVVRISIDLDARKTSDFLSATLERILIEEDGKAEKLSDEELKSLSGISLLLETTASETFARHQGWQIKGEGISVRKGAGYINVRTPYGECDFKTPEVKNV